MKETVDLGGGYLLRQPEGVYPCGTDAVLLSDFAATNGEGSYFVDLCSGSGVVPILVCKRRRDVSFSAVEISKFACEIARENIDTNGLSNKISIYEADVKSVNNVLDKSNYNCVTVNPPYLKKGSCRLPKDEATKIAVAEVLCTVDDVVSSASYLLKDGGSLFMVHRTERFDEIIETLAKHGFMVKLYRPVYNKAGGDSKICLIHAVKGSVGIGEVSPLVLNENGKPSKEAGLIYGE